MLEYRLDLREGSRCIGFIAGGEQARLPFYLTSIGHYVGGAGYYTRRSDSPGYLILFSRAGVGKVQVGQEQCLMPAGTALLTDCTTYHSYETQGTSWDMYWIHLEGEGVAGYHQLLREQGAPVLPISRPEELTRSLERYLDMAEVLSIENLSEQALGMHRLFDQMLRARLKAPDSGTAHRMEEAAAWIRGHFREPVRLEELAARCCLSKYHFIRLFKARIGLPPHRYLIRCRVARAQELLRRTDLPVSEIALQTGFGSTNSLLTHFRTLIGATPAAYRRTPDFPHL